MSAIEVAGGRYVIRLFEDWGVRLMVDRLKIHREGNWTGRLRVEAWRGEKWATILDAKVNLSAIRSRKELADTLQKAHPLEEGMWLGIIERSFQLIISAAEQGEPVVQLVPRPDEDLPFLIEPLLMEGNITLVYGPGGSGKSLLALWLAILAENGTAWDADSLKVARQTTALYLDWETDQEILERRLGRLAVMLPDARRFPLYRRCILPISEDEENIALAVAENNVGLLIIDSAGMASAGDILSAEAAIRFFGSLRRILAASPRASALVLTHVAKGEKNTDRRSPIGSVYFENIPRAVWELRALSDDHGDSVDIILRCAKANEMAKPRPLGFRVVFGNGFISISPSRPPEVLDEAAASAAMIIEALSKGPLSPGQIAEITGLPASSVRVLLGRLRDRGKVVHVERGQWALAARDAE